MLPLLYEFQDIGEECSLQVVDDSYSFTITLGEAPPPTISKTAWWLLAALAAGFVVVGAVVATRPKKQPVK